MEPGTVDLADHPQPESKRASLSSVLSNSICPLLLQWPGALLLSGACSLGYGGRP